MTADNEELDALRIIGYEVPMLNDAPNVFTDLRVARDFCNTQNGMVYPHALVRKDDVANAITALRARVATEAAMRVQCSEDSQMHLDRALAAESQLQQVKADAERMVVHESWLAHRIEWLKSEAHKGGDWECLRIKWEETAYVLEKFRSARRNDGTA